MTETDKAAQWCKVFTERLRLCLNQNEITALVSGNNVVLAALQSSHANYYAALNDRIKARRDELKGN